MNRRVMNGIVLAIIMLGAIGLITTLVTNPLGFFKQIAIYAAIAGVIYLLYRLFIRKSTGSVYSTYTKAAKRSKRRFNDKKSGGTKVRNIAHAKKAIKSTAIRKKNPTTHLTVIEGKKGKKKNRASF